MKKEVHGYYLQFLLFQRNLLLVLTILSSFSLATVSIFLFQKRERVVVVPASLDKSVWTDANGVSLSYLEQFGTYIGQLLLSKSPNTASSQRAAILTHTDPSFYGMLRSKLLEEEEMISQHHTSYCFFPREVQVVPGKLEVVLRGDRDLFSSDKKVSSESEGYSLSFSYTGGQLRLTNLQREES